MHHWTPYPSRAHFDTTHKGILAFSNGRWTPYRMNTQPNHRHSPIIGTAPQAQHVTSISRASCGRAVVRAASPLPNIFKHHSRRGGYPVPAPAACLLKNPKRGVSISAPAPKELLHLWSTRRTEKSREIRSWLECSSARVLLGYGCHSP